jgi:hypothetical protein
VDAVARRSRKWIEDVGGRENEWVVWCGSQREKRE